LKTERVKEVQQKVANEIAFRLGQELTDSEHDLQSMTIIVDFHNGMVRAVLSRVETKCVMK